MINIVTPGQPEPKPVIQYPQVIVDFADEGMIITIMLGPTTKLLQLIDAASMDIVVQRWQSMRGNPARALGLIEQVRQSKLP